jgi:solute carrier family 35 (UDP-galactose transporter), member B1
MSAIATTAITTTDANSTKTPVVKSKQASPPKPSSSPSFFHLIFCAAGIYGFFLTWGILQERISTMEYVGIDGSGVHSRFRYFQVLNMIQAGFAAILAFLQISLQRLPLCGPKEHPQKPSSLLLFSFLKIAICSSVASSLGYRSLRHLNYPTMILGKSCKLVPVMLMNFLIYRKRFELYKYGTVALITIGVSGFMLFESKGKTSSASPNSLFGLGLLLGNLLMDGATNSWQDQLFLKYRLKSQQLMMFMNLFSGLLLALSLVFYTAWKPESSQLLAAIQFFRQFPSAIPDVLAFSACGALGQLFIFHTLEHFGSLSLVTITVTRKLFTILLSLFWFNHQVNTKQWLCVSLVFVALILESFIGKVLNAKKTVKAKDDSKAAPLPSTVDDKFLIIPDSPADASSTATKSKSKLRKRK